MSTADTIYLIPYSAFIGRCAITATTDYSRTVAKPLDVIAVLISKGSCSIVYVHTLSARSYTLASKFTQCNSL